MVQNEDKLRNHPRLQPPQNNRAGGVPTSAPAGGGTHTPPTKTASNAHKGLYGEARARAYLSDEHPHLKKLGRDKGVFENGIDGVYKNATPPPDYVLVEAKYNTGKLGQTRDGKQMSDGWLQGEKTRYDRIMDAVGESEAKAVRRAVRSGNAEKWLVRVDEQGGVTKRLLDAKGNLVKGQVR